MANALRKFFLGDQKSRTDKIDDAERLAVTGKKPVPKVPAKVVAKPAPKKPR